MKKAVFARYLKNYTDVIEYHGIAFDEQHRTKKNNEKNVKYPLVEWGIIEREALNYCYSKGFDWDGLYEKFHRVSCWCCPLSRIGELRCLYNDFPELWQELRTMDSVSYRDFRSDYTIQQLEDKFKKERPSVAESQTAHNSGYKRNCLRKN